MLNIAVDRKNLDGEQQLLSMSTGGFSETLAGRALLQLTCSASGVNTPLR